MKRVTVMIDGGHLRSYVKKANKRDAQLGLSYDPAMVVRVAKACVLQGEDLFRILYYDCDEFAGSVKLPVSNGTKVFNPSNSFLNRLAEEELVAVRRGIIKFRGWERTSTSLSAAEQSAANGQVAAPINDNDFRPRFEQKGVDLRIGLDMTAKVNVDSTGLLILITGDTDLIPALKIVRSRGIQVAGVNLPNYQILPELKHHLDIYRTVSQW